MNDLNDRLDALADAGAGGIDLARPDGAGAGAPWWRRPSAFAVAGVAVVLLVVAAAAIVLQGDDDETVRAAQSTEPASGLPAPQVAVTYGDASVSGRPVEQLTLRFLRGDGTLVAERQWSEVEEPVSGSPGQVMVLRGLIQPVPAGDIRLEVTWIPFDTRVFAPLECSVDFRAAAGDRLILRLKSGADLCAGIQPESVEEWTRDHTGQTGLDYLGLPLAEAEAKAEAAGLTSRVVGDNGMDLAVTMDLRTDRIDLMVFDGVVVAAILGGEAPVEVPTATASTSIPSSGIGEVLVDFERFDDSSRYHSSELAGLFDVTVRFVDQRTGDVIAERSWSRELIGNLVDQVLHQDVPGTVRIDTVIRMTDPGAFETRCSTTVDPAAGDHVRATLLWKPDETEACASIAAASAAADELLDLPRGWPAPGFVGLTEAQAEAEAADRGWTTRVVARDGTPLGRNDDLREDRVDLVIEDGVVTAAART